MKERRVVVTGLGILSPVGNNINDSWLNITSGISGVSNIDYFDTCLLYTSDAADE